MKFMNFKTMLLEIKPFTWKKREKILDVCNYMHLKHFRSCQLLGPSTLTATHKTVLVLYIFNLESRGAWCSAASIAPVTHIRDMFVFHSALYLYCSFCHKSWSLISKFMKLIIGTVHTIVTLISLNL